MCSGKLFHNLASWYVKEFRPSLWVVVLHFGCMMILLALRLYGNYSSLNCSFYLTQKLSFSSNTEITILFEIEMNPLANT